MFSLVCKMMRRSLSQSSDRGEGEKSAELLLVWCLLLMNLFLDDRNSSNCVDSSNSSNHHVEVSSRTPRQLSRGLFACMIGVYMHSIHAFML